VFFMNLVILVIHMHRFLVQIIDNGTITLVKMQGRCSYSRRNCCRSVPWLTRFVLKNWESVMSARTKNSTIPSKQDEKSSWTFLVLNPRLDIGNSHAKHMSKINVEDDTVTINARSVIYAAGIDSDRVQSLSSSVVNVNKESILSPPDFEARLRRGQHIVYSAPVDGNIVKRTSTCLCTLYSP
jgi:hypothetical protein